ncbi:hypothetical protein GCM10010503_69270 [Streptomyces lucensis JCM 4490]|uniref:Uncharacterized protein n=1 Tax=Streptomyces lucensis JCM 4490 TaxID=1306176 RepID=A0A918JIA3_9ACTN|nr:hypothetical protein GCM10010503_69270 [Streptomyces lucensis JCM 4490]
MLRSAEPKRGPRPPRSCRRIAWVSSRRRKADIVSDVTGLHRYRGAGPWANSQTKIGCFWALTPGPNRSGPDVSPRLVDPAPPGNAGGRLLPAVARRARPAAERPGRPPRPPAARQWVAGGSSPRAAAYTPAWKRDSAPSNVMISAT